MNSPWNKGKKGAQKHSEETRKYLAEILRKAGVKSQFKKGNIPWIKGKKGFIPWNKGKTHTEITRKKISEKTRGRKQSPEEIKHRAESRKGYRPSEATKRKVSEAFKGEKSHFWKGGITPINSVIRSSLEYKLWREAVFKRDNYTCIWCGDKRGGKLNADHIKPFALFPELRFALDNGRTLCEPCHKKTDTYGSKTR